MRNVYLLFTLITFASLFSCSVSTSNEKNRNLSFSDLDLSLILKIDTNKRNNKIVRTEHFSGNTNTNENLKMFAWSEYDSLGRTTKSYLNPPYHNNSDFLYNKNNLIKGITYNKTDTFKAKYKFDSINNILYQFWNGTRTDTNLYFFNSSGKLIKSLGPSKVQQEGMFSWDQLKLFEYTEKNQLSIVTTIQLMNKSDTINIDSLHLSIKFEEYFYHNSHLDSIISNTNYKTGEHSRRVRSYDNTGNFISDKNEDGNIFRTVNIKH